MTTYTILRKSTPASPRRDVKMTPVWRICFTGLDADTAKARIESLPLAAAKNRLIIKDSDRRQYL